MPEYTPQECFNLWEKFTEKWPIDNLQRMTLGEYNALGDKNSFCYWLESITTPLGSIWGGSAFKFGIFEFDPNSKNAKDEGAGFLKDDKYKWLEKYGKTASEAFEKIKGIVIDQLGVEDPDRIQMDTSMTKDLEADSLYVIEVIMAIEEEFDIEIPDEDAEQFTTMEDIVNYVADHAE